MKPTSNRELLESLLAVAWPEFVEMPGGFVFLKSAAGDMDVRNRSTPEPDFDRNGIDKTGLEALENHLHLEDHIKGLSPDQIREIASLIAEMWSAKLHQQFPGRGFRIYLIMDDHDTILRFHQNHAGEPPWLDEDDWEEAIREGAVQILEI